MVCYLRVEYNDDSMDTSLVKASSHVAKATTLPLRELHGLKYVIQLAKSPCLALGLDIRTHCHFYTDSHIVIQQLNRVHRLGALSLKAPQSQVCCDILKEINIDQIGFVPGHLNITADLISKPENCTTEQVMRESYQKGPAFLCECKMPFFDASIYATVISQTDLEVSNAETVNLLG